MKKVLFIIVIALATTSYIKAQEKDSERIGGLRFGWQRAAIYENGSIPTGYEPLQTFYIGFSKEKNIAPLFSVGSGLEYFQNGIKVDDDNKTVLHYLSVPFDLKLKIGPVFALGGIAPSFLVAERQFVLGVKTTPADDAKMNWFDVPVFFGAGVKFLFLTIEGRYHWGLLELGDGDGSKNQYFQLGAGLSF